MWATMDAPGNFDHNVRERIPFKAGDSTRFPGPFDCGIAHFVDDPFAQGDRGNKQETSNLLSS